MCWWETWNELRGPGGRAAFPFYAVWRQVWSYNTRRRLAY